MGAWKPLPRLHNPPVPAAQSDRDAGPSAGGGPTMFVHVPDVFQGLATLSGVPVGYALWKHLSPVHETGYFGSLPQ